MFNVSNSVSSSSVTSSIIYQGFSAFNSMFNQLNKMETFSKLSPPETVRIKAKLVERLNDNISLYSMSSTTSGYLTSSNVSPTSSGSSRLSDSVKFCVDPQRTSFSILRSLISQAFQISQDFQMSYLSRENNSIEYISLGSDFDLDEAFNTSSNPYLSINIQPNNNDLTEWDIINSVEINPIKTEPSKRKRFSLDSLTSSTRSGISLKNKNPDNRSLIAVLSNQTIGRAASFYQKLINSMSHSDSSNSSTMSKLVFNPINSTGINLGDNFDIESPIPKHVKHPLGLGELKNFLDSDGRVVQPTELRQRIFDGGCEVSSRKELWPILLNVYPSLKLTSKQRGEFIKKESKNYERLKTDLWYGANKNLWKSNLKSVPTDSKLNSLANKIHKDVWRTDSSNRFYSSDKNVESMFNILMTYALDNDEFYAQGLSDLLSPILFVLKSESLAYICFCSLMRRCIENFDVNSVTIASKISLLNALLQRYDTKFFEYLKQVGADQLLFTYRWLLIECKREFPFERSLTMLEVMWSTIEPVREKLNKNRLYPNLYKRLVSDLSLNERINDTESSDNALDSSFISSSPKSRHQSQQSQNSGPIINSNNNNNNNNNTDEEHGPVCRVCLTESPAIKPIENSNCIKKMDEDDVKEDDDDNESGCCSASSADATDLRNRRKRLLSRNRRRYFSLNLDPVSKPRIGLCLQLNDQQMEEKKTSLLKSIKNSTTLPQSITNFKRSLSFCDCLNEVDSSNKFNLRASFSQNNLNSTSVKSVPIKLKSPNNIATSATSKFSTSETETIIMSNQKCRTQNKNISMDTKTTIYRTQTFIENRFIKRFNTFKLHHCHYNHSNHSHHHKHNYKKLLRRKQTGIFNQDASCSEVEEDTLQEENSNFHSNQTKQCNCSNSMFNSYKSLEDKSKIKNKSNENLSERPVSSFDKFVNNNKENFDKIHCQHPIEIRRDSSELDFISELPIDSDLTDSLSKQDNPFHLFLCFSLFVEHRNHIMRSDMDANDIACFFDKMTRLHNMKSVLNRARYLYTELYLKRANAISYIQSFNEIQNTP